MVHSWYALGTVPVLSNTSEPKGTLLRVLGVGFGIAVSLGNSIGSGIMRTPGEIAARLPSISLVMFAWIVGALYSLAGAWSLSEVGAMIPSAGAYYSVARRAFGHYISFVVGWTDWVSLCAATAVITLLAGEYLGNLVPRFAGRGVSLATVVVVLVVLIQMARHPLGQPVSGHHQRDNRARVLLPDCRSIPTPASCVRTY